MTLGIVIVRVMLMTAFDDSLLIFVPPLKKFGHLAVISSMQLSEHENFYISGSLGEDQLYKNFRVKTQAWQLVI